MKKKDRGMNIFNMSMLDVITGALGVFLLIMVILFPYYKSANGIDVESLQNDLEKTKEKLQKMKENYQQAQNQAQEAEQRAQESEQRAQEAEEQLSKNYLFILFEWTTNHDIDIHLYDPNGKHFYYEQQNFSGYPGDLSVDIKNRPGVEVWRVDEAKPGKYKLYANFYNRDDNASSVVEFNAKIFARNVNETFSNVKLTQINQDDNDRSKMKLMAEIVVKDNGEVEVNRP